METKNFKAPNGQEDIRVALTSGHACVLGQEFMPLPPIYWAEAYAAGAVSDDMTEEVSVKKALAEQAKEKKKIDEEFYQELKTKLTEVYNKPTGLIDREGFPLYRKVTSIMKKAVKKDLITKAWEEIKTENETNESE